MTVDFNQAYKNLNKAQRDAVDSTEGPVMVIAGPGTGKTQVLALRIANILLKTDTKADSILCLTFTRSGVKAMQNRLEKYIGQDARNVAVNTFHSFAGNILDKYYEVLDFTHPPKLMDDTESVFLIDEVLHSNDWEYLKARTNPSQYFNDIKGLISFLKKERLTPEEFLDFINEDIKNLKEDPKSISSRGQTKGQLKKEIVKKIESLERTIEFVKFYEIYEEYKKEKNLIDYDDVIEYSVKIMELSEDASADVREEYQYILVDEHQDSSFVQNNFLKAVWGEVEMPNIFVVGDDRQLIYGFSGANQSHFEEFAHFFGKAKIITLTQNYRSTKNILDLADELLSSSLTKEKLESNSDLDIKINLSKYNFSRDEIVHIGLKIKELINQGEKLEDIAVLLPKNKNVKEAAHILNDMGIPVVSEKNVSIFDLKETDSLIRVLKIINDPHDNTSLCASIIDSTSGIDTFSAHKFIKGFKKPSTITIDDLLSTEGNNNLFSETDRVFVWGKILKSWIDDLSGERVSRIVSIIGNDLLIKNSKNQDDLLKNVELVRSMIHLAFAFEEKNKKANLFDFLKYFERLEEYNTHVNIAIIGRGDGVHVMTLHRSKGLEYKYVFIAHMNEEVLMSAKRNAFTLPEKVKELVSKKDTETAKKEIYVAITRAKEYCFISYSQNNLAGKELSLLQIIEDLDKNHFVLKDNNETESEIINSGIENFAIKPTLNKEDFTLAEVKDFVKEKYSSTNVTVSLLNNFFECTWRWYFRNFLKLPEVKSKSLALGSAVHSVLEFILKEKVLPSDDVIKNQIHYELEKEGVENSSDFKKLSSDAFKAIKNWTDCSYEKLSKNYKTERSISFKDKNFPELNMYGKIDLTERFPDESIVITDFKTGSSKTTGMIEKLDNENRLSSYMRQLTMYSYLVQGTEEGAVVSESRLLFLEESPENKNYIYSTNITEEHIDLLLRDIKEYEESLQNGSWVERVCNFKPYGGKNTECEYCATARHIFQK